MVKSSCALAKDQSSVHSTQKLVASQPPVPLAPEDLTWSSGLTGHLHSHMDTHTHTHTFKNVKIYRFLGTAM